MSIVFFIGGCKMLVEYTLRGVGGNINNKYTIRDFQLSFNSRTQVFTLIELELLNDPVKIISVSKINRHYDTYKGRDCDAFIKYCDSVISKIRNLDNIGNLKINHEDDWNSYCMRDIFLLSEEMI